MSQPTYYDEPFENQNYQPQPPDPPYREPIDVEYPPNYVPEDPEVVPEVETASTKDDKPSSNSK